MACCTQKLSHVLSLLLLFCLPSSSWAQPAWAQPAWDSDPICPFQHRVSEYPSPKGHDGWDAKLIVKNLHNPRGLLIDKNGHLLVVETHAGITRFELDDRGGTCMRVRRVSKLFPDDDGRQELNRGIALDTENDVLYASSKSNVYSWPYDSKQDSLDGTPTLVVEGLDNNPAGNPQSDDEPRLLISKKVPGLLLVSRGAFGYHLTEDQSHQPEYGQVKAFSLDRPSSATAYNFTTDGKPLAWALWSAVGMAEHPKTGWIWATNDPNNPQQAGVQPASELNFLGSLDSLNSSEARDGHFGAAWCPAIWSTEKEGRPTTSQSSIEGLKPGDRFLISGYGRVEFRIEYPFVDPDTICKGFRPADHVLAPNSQPTDLVFSPDGSEAIISFRGNARVRDNAGYRLGRVRFNDDGMTAVGSDGANRLGVDDVLTNARGASQCHDSTGCFHPTGLATDSTGRVYMVSEPTGEIYVLH